MRWKCALWKGIDKGGDAFIDGLFQGSTGFIVSEDTAVCWVWIHRASVSKMRFLLHLFLAKLKVQNTRFWWAPWLIFFHHLSSLIYVRFQSFLSYIFLLHLLIFKYPFIKGVYLYKGNCYENAAYSDKMTFFFCYSVFTQRLIQNPPPAEPGWCCLVAQLLKCSSSCCFPGYAFFPLPILYGQHLAGFFISNHSVSVACIKTHLISCRFS